MRWNTKLNYVAHQKCASNSCHEIIEIRMIGDDSHPDCGLPVPRQRKKRFCSVKCQNEWQKSVTWESRIGTTRADEIRRERSIQVSGDKNPSKIPSVAAKIGSALSKFIAENPGVREGENNGFYGKTHSEETIQHWKDAKTGVDACNEEQRVRQRTNSPKKEKHPNWNGGSSAFPYGPEFTRELKSEIKESYGHICQLCGAAGVDLDVHHIDYDKLNNHSSNLIPLCKSCHGKTNYQRDEWQALFEGMKKETV